MPLPDYPLPYSDDIENRPADEDATIDAIIAAMTRESWKAAREGHTVGASHAKASAFLKGWIADARRRAARTAPRLFVEPKTFPVAVRMAEGPGEHLPDSISTHRGMATKVLASTVPRSPATRAEPRLGTLAGGEKPLSRS